MTKTKTTDINPVQGKANNANVLVVDNDPELARFMLEILAGKGICAHLAKDKKTALEFLDKGEYGLVFASLEFDTAAGQPPGSGAGFDLLRKIRANSPELPVIMVAQAENQQAHIVETAVRAIRAGCCDFLLKPLETEKIENLLDTFLPNHSVSTAVSAGTDSRGLYTIVGRSPKLFQTINLAKRVAPTSVPVLISGESGTGKELISYLIHNESKRAHGPYLKVNCAALSDSLYESELFGHEKGAFTGAYARRKGRFEMTHGGTLLLDEITETPLKFQAKLLRVIEQQDFERVGGNENIKVDVRIISTTNKNLLEEVHHGRFREDLYYRLSGVRLVLSPLRQRLEDLHDLIWYFVNLHARQVQRRITELDPVMVDIFANYSWPGNVRQLRNVVMTSLILGTGPRLSLADVSWLFEELQPLPQQSQAGFIDEPQSIASTAASVPSLPAAGLGGIPLVQIERQAILETMDQTAGNQTKAAKVLGISDRTLRDRLRRYREQNCTQLTQ